MAQDPAATRPITSEPPSAPDPSASDNQRIRRRLGGWQDGADSATASFGDPLSTAPLDVAPAISPSGRTTAAINGWFDGPATAPLAAGNRPPSAPVDTAPIVFGRQTAATAQMPDVSAAHGNDTASFSGATAPINRATVPIAPPTAPFAAATSPIASATAPMDAATAQIGAGAAATATIDLQPSLEATVSLNGHGSSPTATIDLASASTMPIAAQTAQIENVTAEIAASEGTAPMRVGGGNDSALTAETLEELDRYRARVKANPSDSDALFELSVALHRAGLRSEARDVLTKLVALYEQRGQVQQAARIKGMLGAPKTGPIAPETQPIRSSDRTGTIPFSSATTPLRNTTAGLKRTREQARAKQEGNQPAFAPESLIFTIPLPDENSLEDEAHAWLKQSERELKARQFQAALDSCVQVISLAPEYTPVFLRVAEIYTRQRLHRRARAQAEALIRLAHASDRTQHLWMVYRVLLHASESDETSLRQLVELLIDAGQPEQASFYASRLIQLLDAEGLSDQALQYSIRLGEIIPGDTRAALENAILRLKGGDRGGALDRWESAVKAGADPIVAKASIAALTSTINEDDHWKLLASVVPVARQSDEGRIEDAYARTAAALAETPTLLAGRGILLAASDDPSARELLAHAAGARSGSPFARAVSAVALAWSFGSDRVDEYVAAVRTALKLLTDEHVANHPSWTGLVGRAPRFEDLSLELGEALLARSDAAGAAEVLKEAHARTKHHGPICERLAEAYFKIGQLGSALTVLDELAVHYRSTGQLEAMAGVLRHMSQLAPNNIKVKSRLIDAYLQRGFVAEARAELIQRADLEERSGLIKDAMNSLQRAADLSWTIGLAEETFSLYSRVIEMAPDDVGNRTALVNFYLQMGRLSEAAEHQRAVVDIALRGDNKHEAVAALHQVIGLTPDDTNAYYQLAELLATMGEFHQAEKVYRRLVLMNPGDAIAQAKATAMAALKESKGR